MSKKPNGKASKAVINRLLKSRNGTKKKTTPRKTKRTQNV